MPKSSKITRASVGEQTDLSQDIGAGRVSRVHGPQHAQRQHKSNRRRNGLNGDVQSLDLVVERRHIEKRIGTKPPEVRIRTDEAK
jgi:hypothetical protein